MQRNTFPIHAPYYDQIKFIKENHIKRKQGESKQSFQARAEFVLGRMYDLGEQGLPIDTEQAVKIMFSAATKGNAGAQAALGYAYSNGDGIERNEKEAIYWLDKAIQQNCGFGYIHFGLLYLNREKNKSFTILINLLLCIPILLYIIYALLFL